MPTLKLQDHYTPHNSQIAFHQSPEPYKLIGGGMGGGKSVALCGDAMFRSLKIKGNRGAIIRKNMTTLKRTTMVTFFQLFPKSEIKEYNKSDQKVTCRNGSEILFLEADESKDPLFEKLKSLELGWFAIDEASEIPRAAFQILVSRLRWKPAAGYYSGLLASNPEQCWLKEDFIDSPKPGHKFYPSLLSDNPDLPEGYVDSLKLIFDDIQQRKYIDGDWSISDDPMQIIPYAALRACVMTPEELQEAKKVQAPRSMGVDVGELGNDKTVLSHWIDSTCIGQELFEKKRTDEVSKIVASRMDEFDIRGPQVGIDSTGVGAGVYGELTGRGFSVKRIMAGEKAKELSGVRNLPKFANLKAQMWWITRIEIMNGTISLPNIPTLIQDLAAVRYRVAGEKQIEVESKDSLKKRLGRSPDEGEAFVIANWVRASRVPFTRDGSKIQPNFISQVQGY